MGIERVALLGLWGLGLAACRPVEPAPEDLSGLMERGWFAFHTEDELDVAVVIDAIDDLIDVDALSDGYQDGRQGPFTAEAQALVSLRAPDDDDGTWTMPDPAAATPLFFLNRYACDFEQLERILVAEEQKELYELYDAYERTFIGSKQDYLAGEVDALTWTGSIDTQVFPVGDYTYVFETSIRRHLIEGDHPSAGQHAALVRTFIPVPVIWRTENRNYPQDYQIEIYVPYEGDIVHVYAIWRQMELGSIGDMNGDVVARTTLVTFRQWDDKTEDLCAEGRP